MRMLFRALTHFAGMFGVILFFSSSVYAKNFPLPSTQESLIGDLEYTKASNGDTPTTLAERYDLGLNAIVAANPGATETTVFRSGTSIKIASQFLLPSTVRRGIVINLPEMRMYYYPEGSNQVMTFPIGIGRIGKIIPIENTKVVRKVVNPVWVPTQNIREYNEQQGIQLPAVMPAGPDNPLGPYAIYLRIPTFLIHSTIFPESIGRRASFGCIRMNENDIKEFFPLITPGTPVAIIDMPNKIAWNDNILYLEAHMPLEERAHYSNLDTLRHTIRNEIRHTPVTLVNWPLVTYLSEDPDGVPHEIGLRID